MASSVIGIIAALPWATILEKAPGIADRASGLLASVRGSRRALPTPPTETTDAAERERQYRATIAALEGSIGDLDRKMADAGALIASLAESNRTLVQTVAKLRNQLAVVAGGCVVSLVVAAFALLR